MGNAEIVIRKAVPADAGEIWHLLHNNNIHWGINRILQEINSLTVLSFDQKLLGVIHGSVNPGLEKIFWVAGHPMYPEDALVAAMAYGLFGVNCRLPGVKVEQIMKSYLKMHVKPLSTGFGIR